ncbi:MAG: Asp-tRNA(Asn)/Glu-tRNA(Gln) amidotransferase subunit GatC [Hyphomicrobiales bacterium]|nr:Asp-tRNA(Asn)/Glu-tRNA(Gln) amidotransferase subunit GatC [Hyphomicrobiales bacterium]
MSVDKDTVLRVAKLARIAVSDAEAETMKGELNEILDWVEQLQAVDVEGVEPMTAVVETRIKMRTDVVNDGEKAGDIVQNAPLQEDQFFMVPKVVE